MSSVLSPLVSIQLTTKGADVNSADVLKLFYIDPAGNFITPGTKIEIDNSDFTAAQYEVGRTFSIPVEAYNSGLDQVRLLLRNTNGASCTGTESGVITKGGFVVEEGTSGPGNDTVLTTYSFGLGSTNTAACVASPTTIYIGIDQVYSLQNLGSNLIIYSNTSLTRLSTQFISDGVGVRRWNNEDGVLEDYALC